MKILKNLYMVGSGEVGMFLSNRFDCNTYMLDCGNGELVLIDAGTEEDPKAIFEVVESHGLSRGDISTVLVTHSHYDHVGGCRMLREMGSRIFAPEIEAKMLESGSDEELELDRLKRSAPRLQEYKYPHCKIDRVLKDGEVLTFGDLRITVIHTPGHSLNSTCYLVDGGDRRMLFSGDYLCLNGRIGLLNNNACSLRAYRGSAPKLAGLGVEGLFPAHFRFLAQKGQEHIDMFIEAMRVENMPKGWDSGMIG